MAQIKITISLETKDGDDVDVVVIENPKPDEPTPPKPDEPVPPKPDEPTPPKPDEPKPPKPDEPAPPTGDTKVIPEETNYTKGSYIAYAAPWGAQANGVQHGVDYEDTITVTPDVFPNKTIIDCRWPNRASTTGVWGYIALSYGNADGGVPQKPVEPVQISAMKKFVQEFDFEVSGETDHMNVLNEFWLTGSAGNASDKKAEIGFFLHCPPSSLGYHQGGVNIGIWTDPEGRQWTCRQVVGGWPNVPFITFVPPGQSFTSGRLDCKAAIDWLVSKGKVQTSWWVNGVAHGVEPLQGKSRMNSKTYAVALEAGEVDTSKQTDLITEQDLTKSAYWVKDGMTAVSSSKVMETTSSTGHGVYNQSLKRPAGSKTWTAQADVVADTGRKVQMQLWPANFGPNGYATAVYDPIAGTVSWQAAANGWTGAFASIDKAEGGGSRIKLKFTTDAGSEGFTFFIRNSAGDAEQYAGDTTKGLIIKNIKLVG